MIVVVAVAELFAEFGSGVDPPLTVAVFVSVVTVPGFEFTFTRTVIGARLGLRSSNLPRVHDTNEGGLVQLPVEGVAETNATVPVAGCRSRSRPARSTGRCS